MNNNLNKLRYLLSSLWFCFHYLPWKQAVKLPILFVSKPLIVKAKGRVVIHGPISRGMILLGVHSDPAYEQLTNRFVWSNEGECVFNGLFYMKVGGAIAILKNGILILGHNITLAPLCRITCSNSITIGDNVRLGMEITIMDTDFHHTYNLEKDKVSSISKPIKLSKNCWVGFRCLILKGTELPPYTIVGAYTVCNRKMEIPSYCLIAGAPASIKVKGIARLLDDNVSAAEIDELRKQYQNEERF